MIWNQLPIESILNLCDTNKQFKEICTNDWTWNYLLERDFKIKYKGNDPKTKYIIEYTRRQISRKKIYTLLYEVEELYTVIGTKEDQIFISILKTYNNGKLGVDLHNMIDDYKNQHGITNLEPKDIKDLYLNYDELVIKKLTIDEIFD